MSAPLRIRPPATKGAVGDDNGLKSYLDRLLKLIPAEVLSLYLVGVGIIPADRIISLIGWAVFCWIAAGIVKAYGTSDRARGVKPDKMHVAISMLAFIIWLYSMGGPFEYYGLHEPYLGSLFILAFTFVVPYVYDGKPDTE